MGKVKNMLCDECGEEFDSEEPYYQINPENPDPIANHMMGFLNDQSENWSDWHPSTIAIGMLMPVLKVIFETVPSKEIAVELITKCLGLYIDEKGDA